MFYEMRRKDRMLDEEKAWELLERGEYGIFSTMGENGYPYGVPVNYCCIDEKIYIHGARAEGNKLANVRYCDKACFTVVGNTQPKPSQFSTNYESVIVFGTVRVTEDLQEKKNVLKKILEKYSAAFMEAGMQYMEKAADKTLVYEITPHNITGKSRNS